MTSHRDANVKLFFLPASASPRVVVIRRGPSKWWHFLLWDRDTGIVTPGSWFFGTVYPQRCDLSPKGDWMVMVAYRGTPPPHAWTALCRPPLVTALAFWPQPSVHTGGGFFDGRSPILWLNISQSRAAAAEIREPHPFELGYGEERDEPHGFPEERLIREGWKREKDSAAAEAITALRWSRKSPSAKWRLWLEFQGTCEDLNASTGLPPSNRVQYRVGEAKGTFAEARVVENCEWAGWNSHNEVCFARSERLWTLTPGGDEENPRMVFDLTNLHPPASRRSRQTRATPTPER